MNLKKQLSALVFAGFLVVMLALSTTVATFGQTDTGTLNGTIGDASGAAIPNATVTVTNTANGQVRSVTSNGTGAYSLNDVPAGSYKMVVKASGFGDFTSDVAMSVGGRLTVDAKMGVQAEVSTVEVSAVDAGAEVNTTNQELSQVVTSLEMSQLPSLTRNPYDFVELSGNVSMDPNGSTARGVGVSFSGTRSASTEILLDGVENVDLFSQSIGETVPLDSVEEYRVITSGFSAQYGRATGGIVNLITKGGTNTYHGSAYEFNRLSALASPTYYESVNDAAGNPQPVDHFTENQFGYSIGGPVLPMFKDKLFFFSNTEWNRVRSSGSQTFAIPTPAFIASSAANTQAYFAQYGKLAAGTVVGPVLSDNPDLEAVTVTAPINAGAGNPVNSWFTFDRIDYNATNKTNMYFSYASFKDNIFPGTNSLSPYAGFDTGSTDYDQSALASINHVFAPNVVNATKLTFSRLNGGQPLGPAGVVPGMYLYSTNGASTDTSGIPIVLPGYLPESPGNAIPFAGPQNEYQLNDDFNWTKGRHTFQFGGAYLQVRDNRTFGAYLNGIEGVGAPAGGEAGGLAALQAGTIYSYQVAINPGGAYPCPINSTPTPACEVTLPVGPPSFTHENTFNDGSWYAQDTLKVTPRFTATLGIRWEYYGVQHDTNPNLDTNFYPGTGSNIYEQIRNGSVMPAPQSSVGGLYAKRLNNYAPRIGFAYDLTGDGKTSVRGGYGMAYERNFGNVGFNALFNPPYYGIIDLTSNVGVSGQLQVTTNNYGPLAGAAGQSVPLPPVELRALDPHMPTAYTHQYDLAIEREIAPSTLLSIEYTGTRGIHQYSIANENKIYSGNVYLGDPLSGNTAGDPLNLQYGSINVREANADSYYNGVNVKVQDNNYAKYGLQLTANYTYSHSLDDLSTTFSESNNSFNLGYTNAFDPSLDRGNSDYDVRHRFVASGVYEPKFLEFNSRPVIHTLFGGLEFAPIFTLRSGTPFTIYDCTYALYSCDRINAVPGLQYKGKLVSTGSPDGFNYVTIPGSAANTYQDPIVGVADFPTLTSGGFYQPVGMDKDQFYDPKNWNLDQGVYKNFKINERYTAQFRGEFYNILNHHNVYANAFSSYYESQFDANGNNLFATESVTALKGTTNGFSPSSSDERRNIQLALRLQF